MWLEIDIERVKNGIKILDIWEFDKIPDYDLNDKALELIEIKLKNRPYKLVKLKFNKNRIQGYHTYYLETDENLNNLIDFLSIIGDKNNIDRYIFEIYKNTTDRKLMKRISTLRRYPELEI
jgi:hypothetical protein